jgi:hypothetical protein
VTRQQNKVFKVRMISCGKVTLGGGLRKIRAILMRVVYTDSPQH